MKRILILTNEFEPFKGGVGTYTRELAIAASELGHDVTILAPSYYKDCDARAGSGGYKLQRYAGGVPRLREYPRIFHAARKAASVSGYDVVHAVDLPFAEMLAVARVFRSREHMITLHGSDINREKFTWRGRALRPFRVFESASRVVTNSCYTKSLLLQRFPAMSHRTVSVAPLGVAPIWFDAPAATGRDIFRKLGVSPEKLVVLCVARLTRRKGQHTLVNAVGRLSSSMQDRLACVLVGAPRQTDSEYVGVIERAAEQVRAQIVFAGRLTDDELLQLYSRSAVFCLPGSVEDPKMVEGFGLVFLEAAAQGLPAIAGRVGGVPEVVIDGETGLVLPPDDPELLSEALSRLLADDALRKDLGARARERSRAFTWRRCAELTYDFREA